MVPASAAVADRIEKPGVLIEKEWKQLRKRRNKGNEATRTANLMARLCLSSFLCSFVVQRLLRSAAEGERGRSGLRAGHFVGAGLVDRHLGHDAIQGVTTLFCSIQASIFLAADVGQDPAVDLDARAVSSGRSSPPFPGSWRSC
jgi:hypothetical protein